jgi:hypothetical protein
MSCSGMAPSAGCSLTCTNSCTPGQTSCVAGGLATCTLGSNGCYSYSTPAACGPHQACTGSAGSAACTCEAAPSCSTTGTACASASAYVTCQADANGCLYTTGTTTTCPNGACYGAAGSAQCCTNACQAGSSCQGNTPVTCAVGTNGCLASTQGQGCAGATPNCTGGSCTGSCSGAAGSCATGYCCSGGTCVANSVLACQASGGSCMSCTGSRYGSACLPASSTGCGCASNADCTTASYGTVCGAGFGGECGCTSSSDCGSTPGGCCLNTICVSYGFPNGSLVCENGSFVTAAALGAPCQNSSCGSSYCCDLAQVVMGHQGVCIQSSECEDGSCGWQDEPCCDGTACGTGFTCTAGTCQ